MTGMMVIAIAPRLSVKRISRSPPMAPMIEFSDAAVAASLRLYLQRLENQRRPVDDEEHRERAGDIADPDQRSDACAARRWKSSDGLKSLLWPASSLTTKFASAGNDLARSDAAEQWRQSDRRPALCWPGIGWIRAGLTNKDQRAEQRERAAKDENRFPSEFRDQPDSRTVRPAPCRASSPP